MANHAMAAACMDVMAFVTIARAVAAAETVVAGARMGTSVLS